MAKLLQKIFLLNNQPLFSKRQFVGETLLDIGGGTGAFERRLAPLIGSGQFSSGQFTILDLSEYMMDVAKTILPRNVAMVQGDIIGMSDIEMLIKLPTQFDTAVLSQVLIFLFDHEAAIREKDPDHRFEGEPHVTKRVEILKKIIDKISPGGHLILFDEDPMMYTVEANTQEEVLQAEIFKLVSRPIGLGDLLNKVLKPLSDELRFVCHFEVPIDGRHKMYAMIYRKEQATDRRLNEGTTTTNLRVGLVEQLSAILSRIEDEVEGLELRVDDLSKVPSGDIKYSRIVLPRLLHQVGNGDRRALIQVCAHALEVNGALHILDEFDAPPGSPAPLRNSHFRDTIMPQFGGMLTFTGAVSTPIVQGFDNNMIGYQFRRYQ